MGKMTLQQILMQLAGGMGTSIQIFAVTLVFSLPLGLFVALGRMSRNKILQAVIKVYISVMRGTPLMLQLLVVYFGPYTWGSAMNYHPHIHTIVLGGGLDKDSKWKDTGGKFFLPYGVIAKVFRGKYLCELKSLWNDSKLEFHGTAEKYQNHYCFKGLLDECYKKDWVAYCKETFNGAQSVINYLGKYTHRIAISNHRIKSMTEATVTYAVKDYKNKGQWKEKTVPGEEFIRRFLMHVPPKRFVRIRHYGLLSCRNKSKKMTHCRNLLGCKKYISALKNRSATEMIKLLYNIDVCRCSSCGGKMVPHLPDKHTPSVLAHMRC